jgi:hypothetical protein
MSARAPAKPPAYLRLVLALADRIPQGSLSRVVVEHDAECAMIATRGARCTCDPSVRLVTRQPAAQRRGGRTP